MRWNTNTINKEKHVLVYFYSYTRATSVCGSQWAAWHPVGLHYNCVQPQTALRKGPWWFPQHHMGPSGCSPVSRIRAQPCILAAAASQGRGWCSCDCSLCWEIRSGSEVFLTAPFLGITALRSGARPLDTASQSANTPPTQARGSGRFSESWWAQASRTLIHAKALPDAGISLLGPGRWALKVRGSHCPDFSASFPYVPSHPLSLPLHFECRTECGGLGGVRLPPFEEELICVKRVNQTETPFALIRKLKGD